MNKNDYPEYTGYEPVVKEFLDMASDQDRMLKMMSFLKSLTEEQKALIADAVEKYDLAIRISDETPRRTFNTLEERHIHIMTKIEQQCGYIPRYMKSGSNVNYAFRLARYACFSRKQIQKVEWRWDSFPIYNELQEMMEWYVPEWFYDYFSEQRDKGNVRISYQCLLDWRRRKLIDTLYPPEIAALIPMHFNRFKEKHNNIDIACYINDWIAQYPEILDEIKYLFQYPSQAYLFDNNNSLYEELEGKGPLSYIFKHYSDNGRLDRQWILRETISACNHNFGKEELYWYPLLLQAMEPTKAELFEYQEQLISNLTSVFPHISQAMLKLIRTISTDSRFMIDHFIAYLAPLLSSETKTIVKTTLSIVADMFNTFSDKRDKLCEQLAIVFIHKDDDLQTKAAKWIIKYGDKKTLKPVLTLYKQTLLMSSREILKDFLEKENQALSTGTPEKETVLQPIIRNDNHIAEIGSVEELVFRLRQAFECFRLDSIDLIPQALIRFNEKIDVEVMQQFGPAIKSAEKVLTKWVRGKRSTDEITAYYFLHYCTIRLKQLPQEDKTTKQIAKKFEKLQPIMDEWTKKILNDSQNILFSPYFKVLNMFLKIIRDKIDLPLLSTPTHEPCWIDPIVFLQRFNRYRELNETPVMADMQLAIQRIAPDHTKEALKQIGKEEKTFYTELFAYLFDKNKPLPSTIEHHDLWLACTFPWYGREIPAQLANHYPDASPCLLSGIFEWESIRQESKELPRLCFHYSHFPIDGLKDRDFIGAFMWTKFEYYSYKFTGDMPCLLRMFPNNPEVLLGRYIFEYAQVFDEKCDSWLISVLELLRNLERPLLPMGCLFLALCFLYEGKTTRLYAAEIWADLTALSLIDQEETGKSLGKLLQSGHSPLQRFTDILFDIMLNRSTHHNHELERLVTACLAQLGGRSLPRLKRLQEAHKELVAQNAQTETHQ